MPSYSMIQEVAHGKIEKRRVLKQCRMPHLRKDELSGEGNPGRNRVGLVSLHINVVITVYAPDRTLDLC